MTSVLFFQGDASIDWFAAVDVGARDHHEEDQRECGHQDPVRAITAVQSPKTLRAHHPRQQVGAGRGLQNEGGESSTVGETSNGARNIKWNSRYLCHLPTEIAKIWSPSTFLKDVWTYQISALYHLYV